MTKNKNSAQYLGDIAENVLSKVFKRVKVMPYGNPGYDFICGAGYKIDVKSSAVGDKWGYWTFNIRQNTIPNYFLCIAFNSRIALEPVHLWLFPGDVVNMYEGLVIPKRAVLKWIQYERPLDKVITQCNKIKKQFIAL